MVAPRPLRAVELVFQDKCAFAGLQEAVALTSEFLDCSVELTLAAACKIGSRKLLNRIWNSCHVEVNTGTSNTCAWSIRNYLRADRHYLQFQFRQSLMEIVKTAGEYKYQDLERWLFEHCTDCYVPVEVVEMAAELGKLNLLKFFLKTSTGREKLDGGGSRTVQWGGQDAEKAARNGHSNVVWWLLTHAPAPRDMGEIMGAAVRSGDVPLMEWLMRNGFDRHLDENPTISAAVGTDSLLVVKWVYGHGFTEDGAMAMTDAVANGNLQMVCWLLDHKIGCNAYGAFNTAIHNQCLDVAKVLEAHSDLMDGDHCYNEAMLKAAGSGELEAAKWLFTEFSDDPNIDLLEYVFVFEDEDEPTTVLDAAAFSGNLGMVQYFHKLGLELKALKHKRRTTGKAQRKGRTWSGRGVTCTTDAMDFAARAGNLELVQWLHQNRSEGCTTDAMEFAAAAGDLTTVQWLHEIGQKDAQ